MQGTTEKAKFVNEYIGRDEALKELANAVITQAVLDWKRDRGRRAESEEFFRSGWCDTLARGACSGRDVLRHLRRRKVNE